MRPPKLPPATKVSLVPKSEEPERPLLNAYFHEQRAPLIKSFLTGLIATLVIGTGLGFLITKTEIFTLKTTEVKLELTTANEVVIPPQKAPPKNQLSLISLQDPHAPAIPIHQEPSEPDLTAITPPIPESEPSAELDLETFDSSWEDPKKAQPKIKPKPLAKVKKRGPSPQEINAQKLKRAEARIALLAKKISAQAQISSSHKPHYPSRARRKGIEGRVVISVTISSSGKVSQSHVSQSSNSSALDAAALKAARKFRFTPAKNGLGKAMPSKRLIPFNFKLR